MPIIHTKGVIDMNNMQNQTRHAFDEFHKVIIDDFIYPREQKDNQNIEVLVEKLKAGIILDPILVQRVSGYGDENGEAILLLDGGHRLEAYAEYNKLAKQDGYKEQQPTFVLYKNEVIDYEQNKRDLLQTQDKYMEIWIEKDALSSIFTRVAEDYTVSPSLSSLYSSTLAFR
jgi:hypothetical protein